MSRKVALLSVFTRSCHCHCNMLEPLVPKIVWTISLKISAGTINSLSEDPIDPQELSLSCRMLVGNGQPQVCFSWAIYFSEKHSIIVGTLSGSLCCSCRLKTLTRSFPTKVLAGYPFPTHQIGRQSACQLLCPLLRGLCMSPVSPSWNSFICKPYIMWSCFPGPSAQDQAWAPDPKELVYPGTDETAWPGSFAWCKCRLRAPWEGGLDKRENRTWLLEVGAMEAEKKAWSHPSGDPLDWEATHTWQESRPLFLN